MNPEHLLHETETPITISGMGLYSKYKREAQNLYNQLKGQSDELIESAFELFNERLLAEGNIPDINEIVCTVHADEIFEVHGVVHLH